MSNKETGISTEITANHATIPSDPETLLTRRATAAALTAAGFPVSAATLATRASRGGGPRYRHFGRRPLYQWGDAVTWANARLTAPLNNTSERTDRYHG
jgi:hypothetical protein